METHVLPAIHQTHPCVCSAEFRIVSRLFCSYQDTPSGVPQSSFMKNRFSGDLCDSTSHAPRLKAHQNKTSERHVCESIPCHGQKILAVMKVRLRTAPHASLQL